MQNLIRSTTFQVFLCVFMCSVSFSNTAFASEIKVYLNKAHAEQIVGISEAKSVGYRIHFIYLDRLTELENQVSERVTAEYQAPLNQIVDEVGRDKLMAMDDEERTRFMMERIAQMNQKPLTPKAVLPSEMSDIRHAIAEIIEAEEQGITEDQLPAMMLSGKLYPQSYDLIEVIKND